MSLGRYRFVPWARRGLAAAIATGHPGSAEGRAELKPKLKVSQDGTTRDAEVSLRFYGPGDVVGIDARQIIRTDPRPQTFEFEPNYLAVIEFDSPYYPWLFSPDRSSSRMRPWLCLVVVRRDRAELGADPRRPLPWVSIRVEDAPKELPDLTQSWAWAHAQLTGGGDVRAALEGDPELTLSRLICPRRLEGGTAYLACLVPAFAAGREAGLGQEVTSKDEPAWPPFPPTSSGPEARFELPVYYHWEFTTSPLGDFEALVRRLEARPLGPDEAGAREMDLTTAGSDLPVPEPGEPGSTLGFEGALGVPQQQPTPWPTTPKEQFQAALRERLEAHPTPETTVLTPPVYGHSQAGRDDSVPPDGELPHWLRELNLDPRYRGAAALGTRVVQELQEQLVAAAWDQAGQLERANRILRHAQMARAVASAAHETRVKVLAEESPDALLRLTGPLHGRVRVGRDGKQPHEKPPTDPDRLKTLHGSVRASVFPHAAVSSSFRRVVRPGGPVGRRVPGGADVATKRMSVHLAKGEIEVPIKPAEGAVRFDAVEEGRKLGHINKGTLGSAPGWARITGPANQNPYYIEPEPPAEPGVARLAVTATAPALAPEDGDGGPVEPGEDTARRRRRLTGINERFRQAAGALQEYLARTTPTTSLAPVDSGRELALEDVGATLAQDDGPLDPERTVPDQVLPLVPPPPEEATDPLAPRPAAPRFAQPMWDPLRRLSQDFLLPGAENIKPDTITLLGGNARFIEAYMVGLNHELGSELLWRGMPTDFGATYFHQFWDVRGRGPDGGVTPIEDIPDIGSWSPEKVLGEHAAGVGGAGMLVLLIRGELLRRYPTTAIYAVEAEWVDAEHRLRRPGTREMYPEFRGNLEPDLVFLGFPLSVWEAKGSETHPGWYFVLQEQPTAPRFGFDELGEPDDPNRFGGRPASWSDLTWGQLVETEAAYASLSHVPVEGAPLNPQLLAPPIGNATWGADSAHMAEISLQQPARIAVHAARMLRDAEEQARQVTRADQEDGVVTAITGDEGWRLSASEAIDAIERAADAFFVETEGGVRHKVILGGTPEEPHLTTAPGEPNLLLELPEV